MGHLFTTSRWPSGVDRNTKRPLTVWVDPNVPFAPSDCIKPWNQLCGWNVFVLTSNRQAAHVELVVDNAGAYTNLHVSGSTINKAVCTIVHPGGSGIQVAWHELGHALLFGDHMTRGAFEHYGSRPQDHVCDTAGPSYHPYKGVMSYCTNADPAYLFQRGDADMAEAYSYRIPGTPLPDVRSFFAPPPPPPQPQPSFWNFLNFGRLFDFSRIFGGFGNLFSRSVAKPEGCQGVRVSHG